MLKVIATAPIRLVGSGISHALELRWADVDFANRKITFRTRLGLQVCPMFIEVVPYLRELGVKAPMEKVFPSIPEEPRRVSSLISSMVKKSGVTPWTPLIASIRSTRYLELLQAFPEPLVRSWMGHANTMATDQEWEQAVTEPTVLI